MALFQGRLVSFFGKTNAMHGRPIHPQPNPTRERGTCFWHAHTGWTTISSLKRFQSK